jgi:transcriptional regulator with XRE-family HTH domain
MMHESLPAKLRVLRARQGLTLIEAAEKLGIGRDTLSDLERGNRRPVMPTLAKIAKGYGVPVEDLLEEPVPLGKVPEVGRSEPAMESREYKEVKALDESRYRELALGFLRRMPSDAERIEHLARAAGILEGYVRRWVAELEYLTEKDIYPYGKGIETDYLFQGIANALQKSLLPYAVWVTTEGSKGASESELTASRRLLEGVKSMAGFVERARDTEEERQRRSDPGEVSRELGELERDLFEEGVRQEVRRGMAEIERMLAHTSTG